MEVSSCESVGGGLVRGASYALMLIPPSFSSSLYIISEWLSTLIATTTKLSGARASSSDLARVLYLITRFKSVKSISACEMYYAGDETVVEADVVLPVGMPLKEVHDTMEILAYCLETMPSVGRAYIHPDYNSLGQPAHISDRG